MIAAKTENTLVYKSSLSLNYKDPGEKGFRFQLYE